MWFGTLNGLNRYDPNDPEGGFIHYTTKNGLINNYIWSITEDSNEQIWVGTNKGLSLMIPTFADKGHPSTAPLYRIVSFGKKDGLINLGFWRNSAWRDKKDRIWWGTNDGLTMLDLKEFEVPQTSPSVRLNSIEINQYAVDFRRFQDTTYRTSFPELNGLQHSFDRVVPFQNYPVSMDLPFKLNHLTFNFSALDWVAPHKIKYSYIIEGLEDFWSIPKAEPRADYRNLPYGEHTFKVKAIGQAEIWSEPVSYRFTIRPPWWHSWGAYIGYFLIFSGLTYAAYRFLKRRWLLQEALKREQEESVRLKELDTFKSRLYTNLTHEFRTPLSVILGMADQIGTNPKVHLQEGLQLIRRNGQQLLRLINQLLDLSRLENNSFRLHLQQGDIIPYLRYVTESFQTFANSKNLSLQFFTPLENLIMDYDPEQIKQVMTNLISNAVKFTPSGGAIKVKAIQQANHLNLEVSDTGIGIDPKDLPHIFDRFYQVDGSTTRQGEGTGIGLAHTQELIKLMRGEISVKSILGQGTTFQTRLPVAREAVFMESAPIPPNPLKEELYPAFDKQSVMHASGHSPLGVGGEKSMPQVLIVEDNPDVVTYLKTCLSDIYDLDVAYNGAIGIDKAIEQVPDLIISDVMMPEKDGYLLCDTLKNDERTSHIPIILLTAKADASSKISGLKTGADAYLSKPFNKTELLVRLEMMVKKQKQLAAYFSRQFQQGFTAKLQEQEQVSDLPLENAFIQKVRSIVEEHYGDEDFSLPQLCQKVRMSRSQLYRKMQALINTAPSDFIRIYRLEKAKVLLETTELNVSEVAWRVGYKDISHFSRSFQAEFGMRPGSVG